MYSLSNFVPLLFVLFPSFPPNTEDTIATDMEQATGLERKELEALMEGKEVQTGLQL